ncbi:MAG: portal protein [Neptuniibacter sp.]
MSEESLENNSEVTEDSPVNHLTDWENPPSIRDLKQDYSDAKQDTDNQTLRVNRWLDNFNVEGAAKPKKVSGNSSIQPKLIRKQAEWRYPALSEPFLSGEDIFRVRPAGHTDRNSAYQNQLVLNHQFNNEIDKVEFVDEYVRTAVEEGSVFVRVGWAYEELVEKFEVPKFEYRAARTAKELKDIQVLTSLALQNPDQFAEALPQYQKAALLSLERQRPLYPEQVGMTTEEEIQVIKNRPTLEVCDYRNLTIDPSCNGNLDEARFIIYSFETSKAELQATGLYKNLDRIMVDESSPLGQADHEVKEGANFNFKDEPRKRVIAHEYWGFWDIDDTGVVKPFVATWIGNTLIRMEENPYPDQKLPFVGVKYLPKRKSVYGEPDGALLEDNQKIVGAVTRGMIDIMGKSANGQTGVRKDALDLVNRRKFLKGQDYEFNAISDPRQAFYMHTYPEIPASAFNMLQLQNAEAESMSGTKAFNEGISGQSFGEVAAGVRGALDATSKREMSILRRLVAGMMKIGKKIVSMNSEFLSDEVVIQITDDQNVLIKREALAGKFDLKLSISTAEEDNAQAQELAFMLQTMGPNEEPGLRQILLTEIARLRKMPELAKRLETYQPQPDPLQQRIQELEIEKLEAEIAEIKGKANKHQSGSMVDAAKAENLQSETDLNNLDFVEQESGVKQERDLQKQSEQAKSNAQRDLVSHLMKQQEGTPQPSAI